MQRPRPVLTSASIAAAVTGLAGVLGFLGFTEAETSLSSEATAIGAVVVGAVAVGSHLLAALHAQGKVTPVHDPKADDGTPLLRADAIDAGIASRPDVPAVNDHADEADIDFTPPAAGPAPQHAAAADSNS